MGKHILFGWRQFDTAMDDLARQIIDDDGLRTIDKIYGVPRGGLVPAVALSHRLGKPLITSLEGEKLSRVLVVDDISDSGDTLSKINAPNVATIHYVIQSSVEPSYWHDNKKKGDWIEYPWEKNR